METGHISLIHCMLIPSEQYQQLQKVQQTFSHIGVMRKPAVAGLIVYSWVIGIFTRNSPTFMAHPRSTASFPACAKQNIQK